MRTPGGTDAGGHVEEQLGLYHLGALSEAETRPVLMHLEGCEQCRAARAEVCQVLGALALLCDERDAPAKATGATGTVGRPVHLMR